MNQTVAPGTLTRQELYDRIRESSKDEVILEEMIRLGFWPDGTAAPSPAAAAIRERGEAMLSALARHMPAGTTWTVPEGGLFIWVKLPRGLDAEKLLAPAVAQKVAFVPGAPFFAKDAQRETLRLNFSNRGAELIEVGMERLGAVVREAMVRSAATVEARPQPG